jgi:hypothetical protein
MVREIITLTENTYLLNLPLTMLGKQIEVIAFEINDNSSFSLQKVENSSVDHLRKLINPYRTDLSKFKFERDDANNYERD